MNDYLNRVVHAAETKNLDELKRINAELLTKILFKSLFACLDSSYFPDLCSTFGDEMEEQKAVDKLQQIISGKASFLFEPYNEEAIKEITDYDYILPIY